MHRKTTLGKGAFLWAAGDSARTLAVLDKGKLGVQTDKGYVSLVFPKMIIGESALLEGQTEKRSAALVALEDGTEVTEYPPSMVKDTFDAGQNTVGLHLLLTLIGQTCKNNLLVVAAHPQRVSMAVLLKNQVRALNESIPQLRQIAKWDEFYWTFKFLFDTRNNSDQLRARLVGDMTLSTDLLTSASKMVGDLLKNQDIATYLDDFIAAEREKEAWLEPEWSAHRPR